MTTFLMLALIASTPPQAPPLAAAPPQAPPLRVEKPEPVESVRDVGEEWLITLDGREFRVGKSVEKETALRLAKEVAAESKPGVVAAVTAPATMVAGHSHTCPKCSTTWQHANGDKSASHVCPNCKTVVTKKSGSVLIPLEAKPDPVTKKRVSLNGRWYDQYSDGRLIACST